MVGREEQGGVWEIWWWWCWSGGGGPGVSREKKREKQAERWRETGRSVPAICHSWQKNFQRKNETFSTLHPLESSSSDRLFFALSLPVQGLIYTLLSFRHRIEKMARAALRGGCQIASICLRPSIPKQQRPQGLQARGVADASPSLLGKWSVKQASSMEWL